MGSEDIMSRRTWVRKTSLKFKYWLIVTLLLFLIIAMLGVVTFKRALTKANRRIEHTAVKVINVLSEGEAVEFLQGKSDNPFINLDKFGDVFFEIKNILICDGNYTVKAQWKGAKRYKYKEEGIRYDRGYDMKSVEIEDYKRKIIPVYSFRRPVFDKKTKVLIGSVHLFFSKKSIDNVWKEISGSIIFISIVSLAIGSVGAIILALIVTRPISQLITSVRKVGEGYWDHKIYINRSDEIGELAWAFQEMTDSLKYNYQKLMQANKGLVEKEKIKEDLNIAKKIQRGLLPKKVPLLPGIGLSVLYRAAREVGGDYYDFVSLGNNKLGVAIADISGKGVPASILMAMARSVLRSQAMDKLSTRDVLINMNSILYEDIKEGKFLTACYLLLDMETKVVKLANAGHNPVVFYSAETDECTLINPEGIALGFDAGSKFEEVLEEQVLSLKTGDFLVLYTDGVTETTDVRGREFGEERLRLLVKNNSKKSPKELLSVIDTALKNFAVNVPEQKDDITIIALKIK
jgi:serine phosphatase RsbU (regulator of sigma subunit)